LQGWLVLIAEKDAFIRILVAMLVSLGYLVMTLIVRPYAHQSDQVLAVAAQLALVVSFSGTSYIKAYDETAQRAAATSSPDLAVDVYNFESSNGLVDMLLCFLLGMLALLVGTLVHMILKGALEPTIRLVATRREPDLSLAVRCAFHGFISHGRWPDDRLCLLALRLRGPAGSSKPFPSLCRTVWGTGQDQTHTIVRQLQLLVPGIQIWLGAPPHSSRIASTHPNAQLHYNYATPGAFAMQHQA
jgi:hypothetical protein